MLLGSLLYYLIFPAILLSYLIWQYKRRHFRELADKLPGPPGELLLGNARQFGTSPRELFVNIVRIWKENGYFMKVWVGPYLFVIMSDPKDIEVIMSSVKHIDKAIIYDFMQPWLGKGLLTSTGQKWHKSRKIITPTFHFKILEQFVDVFNSCGDILIKNLKSVSDGKTVDIYNFVTLHALDVICETAMGVSVNAQQAGDSEYVNALRKEADIIVRRFTKPWLYFESIFNLTNQGRSQVDALKILHNMTNNVIRERKTELSKEMNGKSNGHINHVEDEYIGRKKRLAFLDLLLQSVRDGADLSDENIREEVDTFMFEGHDTTTSGICYTLWLLAKHQNVQEKALEELHRIFGYQENIAPNCHDLNEMRYIECIVKEALRMCPSVPFIGRYINEDTPISTGNLVLPAGTSVLISPYLVHRNLDYYDDPDTFNPDRFLPENAQGRHPYSYIPFSAGPRNCIGQKFAMMELKATIAKVLWHYHLTTDADYEPEFMIEIILKSGNGIQLKLDPRTKQDVQ